MRARAALSLGLVLSGCARYVDVPAPATHPPTFELQAPVPEPASRTDLLTVYIAPSADDKLPIILAGVALLNANVGYVYILPSATGLEEAQAGKIVIQDRADVASPNRGVCIEVAGELGGSLIKLYKYATAVTVAHEIGHALGLGHSEEEGNIMNSSAINGFFLNADQIDRLLDN